MHNENEARQAPLPAQAKQDWLTAEEQLLLRLYRQLDDAGQAFIRRALEAMAAQAR